MIPATILSAIEDRTGRPIAEQFDLIAGTSTGGILALGLTKPDQSGRPQFSATALRDVYERDGPQIFRNPRSWWGNLLRPKYVSSTGINRIMKGNLGDTRLKDAVTNILIPCYDINRRAPHIFKSHWARCQQWHDFPMSEVACAAAATPTMFEPAHLARAGGDEGVMLVDGGVFANNPSLLAFAEIRRLFAGKDDEFLVVSLGTGQAMERMQPKRLSDWGYVRWSVPMIELVSESGSEAVHEQMRYLLPAAGCQRYYRFQVDLPDDVCYALDNPARENMAGLIKAAEHLLADPRTDKQLSALCKLLMSSSQQQSDELRERIHQYSCAMAAGQAEAPGGCAEAAEQAGNAGTIPRSGVRAPEVGKGCRILICYAGEDLGVARPLADALAERGIAPSFERFGSQPRANIRRLVRHARQDSLISIVVLSPALLKHSFASQPLAWLYSRTLSERNIILPVIHQLGPGHVPALARHLRWLTIAAPDLKRIFNFAEETTAHGIAPLAERLIGNIHLWLESQDRGRKIEARGQELPGYRRLPATT